ncbi:MAG: TolC family protein [Leptospirillum sp.]
MMKAFGRQWFRLLFLLLCLGGLPGFSGQAQAAGNDSIPTLPPIDRKPVSVVVPEDLTLEDAMQIAIRVHPQYRQAVHQYEANREIIGQAMSNYYPHLSVGAGYNYETGNFVISPGIPPALFALIIPPSNTGFNYYQASATVTETLFTFGQRVTQVRQARYNANASSLQALWTLWTLLANVEIAYDTLAEDQLLVDAAEKTLKDYKDQLKVAQGEYDVGTASKFDLLNARVNLSNAELNLITAKNNVKIARVGLLNAMGVVYGGHFRAVPSLTYTLMQQSLDALTRFAMDTRPDFLALKQQEKADVENELYYKSTFLPSFGANASYSYASIFFPLTYNWSLGATVSVPIFSGFLTVHQVAQAQKTISAARDSMESLRQNLLMQVKQDYLNMQTASERIRTTKSLLSQAKESLRLAEGQYRVGVGSAVAVTQAEADLASARAQYVQAIYGFKIARANLIRDSGMNPLRQLQERKNKGVVAHE